MGKDQKKSAHGSLECLSSHRDNAEKQLTRKRVTKEP
jgi:hypothetical protein